jgi:hypothetical protein
MHLDWIANDRRIPLILIIAAALMYVIGLGTYLAYQRQKQQEKFLRQQAIAECLNSHGHVGPGDTCRYDEPPPTQIEVPF